MSLLNQTKGWRMPNAVHKEDLLILRQSQLYRSTHKLKPVQSQEVLCFSNEISKGYTFDVNCMLVTCRFGCLISLNFSFYWFCLEGLFALWLLESSTEAEFQAVRCPKLLENDVITQTCTQIVLAHCLWYPGHCWPLLHTAAGAKRNSASHSCCLPQRKLNLPILISSEVAQWSGKSMTFRTGKTWILILVPLFTNYENTGKVLTFCGGKWAWRVSAIMCNLQRDCEHSMCVTLATCQLRPLPLLCADASWRRKPYDLLP